MTCENFKIKKWYEFHNEEDFLILKNKLEKISNESFGRVLIPEFKITKCGYSSPWVIEYESEYIKGHPARADEMKIIYEDVVLKDSEWSLNNYHPQNYIVDTHVNQGYLFYVDLEDYGPTSIQDRKDRFEIEYKNFIIETQATLNGLLNKVGLKYTGKTKSEMQKSLLDMKISNLNYEKRSIK